MVVCGLLIWIGLRVACGVVVFSYCICLLGLVSVVCFDWLLVWVVYLIVISFVRGLMLL